MRLTSFKNLPISQKLFSVLAILLIPIATLLYFLVIEKDSLIQFSRKEIAGVAYLRALQQGFVAALDEESSGAAQAIRRAEEADQGRLALTGQAKAIEQAFKSGQFDIALTKLSEAITLASDNSYITLDPDADAYFVGDILVYQGPAILRRASDLVAAARALQRERSEDALIAFAVARDGLASATGNLSADWGKAVKGNADGKLKDAIGAMIERFDKIAPALVKAAKDNDYAGVLSQSPQLESLVVALLPQLDDEMARLLEDRIAGFRSVVFSRLSVSICITILGLLLAFVVFRSIARPIDEIVAALDEINAGRLDVAVCEDDRRDEIGRLMEATRRYREAARQNLAAQGDALQRHEQELRDLAAQSEASAAFTRAMHQGVAALGANIRKTDSSACAIADQADKASSQAAAIASAAQQASHTVHLAASSAEELAHSIADIASSVAESAGIYEGAASDSRKARAMVDHLSQATDRIGAVIGMITEIAGQTNLLSLNATIEAARAGEAGRGFSVVAAEVKSLAGQTAKATEEITRQIGAVTEAVRHVAEAMNGIDGTMRKVSLVSTAIAGVIDEQRAATREIARNIQLAAASSEEVMVCIAEVAEAVGMSRDTSLNVRNFVHALEREAAQLNVDVNAYVARTA